MHKRKAHGTNTRKRTLCSNFPHRSSLIATYGATCTSNFRTASKRGELTSRPYVNSSQHEARSGWHRSQWLTGMGGRRRLPTLSFVRDDPSTVWSHITHRRGTERRSEGSLRGNQRAGLKTSSTNHRNTAREQPSDANPERGQLLPPSVTRPKSDWQPCPSWQTAAWSSSSYRTPGW